jgi:hypothetical protein
VTPDASRRFFRARVAHGSMLPADMSKTVPLQRCLLATNVFTTDDGSCQANRKS